MHAGSWSSILHWSTTKGKTAMGIREQEDRLDGLSGKWEGPFRNTITSPEIKKEIATDIQERLCVIYEKIEQEQKKK